ncbi:MAG: DUF2255 family protein [Microbacterium sp.]
MSTWDADDLRRVDAASELRISSARPDGTLTRAIPIWHAAVGDALYVRSAHGPDNGWFRRAKRSGAGRISAGGVVQDVEFVVADPEIRGPLDAALHAKYDRFGPGPVGAITGDDVLETTLRVVPRG